MAFFLFLFTTQIFAKIEYLEAPQVFHHFEMLSLWRTDYPVAIRNDFQKRFEFTEVDKIKFDQYILLRKKFMKEVKLKAEDHLFPGPDIESDQFAEAFLSSKSVAEAFSKLKKILSQGEMDFLLNFVKTYQVKTNFYLAESARFKEILGKWKKPLEALKAVSHSKRVARFMGVKLTRKHPLKVFLVWWPESSIPSTFQVGDYSFLRVNPLKVDEFLRPEMLTEAMIESLIRRIPKEARDNYQKLAEKECQFPAKMVKEHVFFRPMIIGLGRMIPLQIANRKTFQPLEKWSVNPWISLMAKMARGQFRATERNSGGVGGDFLKGMLLACQEVSQIPSLFPSES